MSVKQYLIILILDLGQYLDHFVNQDEQENSENLLSNWLVKIYQIVNNSKLDFVKTCNFAKEVEIKINMFQAAFEHYLFTALIKNNKKAMFRGDSEPRNGTIMLEIPSSFPFVSFIFKLKFYYLVINLKNFFCLEVN